MISLSIIVPVYNVELYIEECIRSLYRQDIPVTDYEVICIDDCSPDKSAEIIQSMQTEFPTLQLLRHERNKKLGGARNTGIRAAKGKYILFVDSDDMLASNVLKQLIDEMEAHDDEYIHFNFIKFFNDGTFGNEPHFSVDSNQRTGADLFFCGAIPWQQQITAWRKIYRTEFVRRNNLYFAEDIMYEDNDFALRVAAAAQRCRHLDVALYYQRSNPDSVTNAPVSVARISYWQKTWPIITSLLDTIGKQDARFVELIHFYMRYDLWDVLNSLYQLPKSQRKEVKRNLTVSEWLRYIHFLPLKRRIEYIYKLIKA